jgi:hypothetical protein
MVDTDADDEFYGEQGDEGMCEPCRDALIASQERDQWLDDPRRH